MERARASLAIPISLNTKPQLKLATTLVQVLISLGTKFQVKLTIFIFWTKFAQNEHFQSKTKKLNNINEFWIFELV